MFVRCPGCQTMYRLGAERVPAAGLRLRCPGCGNVFRVRDPGTATPPAPPGTAPPTPTVLAAPPPRSLQTGAPPPASSPAPSPQRTRSPGSAPTRIPTPGASPELPGLERDERRVPRGSASAPGPSAPHPTPPVAPRPAPWRTERTLDLGAPAAPPPRLETPPFQVGVPAAAPATAPPSRQATTGAQERARRLARALVSDILVYNQDRRDRALHEGNLASALGAEVNRAWDVYKSKVDPQVLQRTSFFKDALNEILAGGQRLF